MDCARAVELLPWLENGTLDDDLAQALRRHLSDCAGCAAELEETRGVAAIAAGHLPVGALVDYAFATAPSRALEALVEQHVGACAACAAELEMVRASRAHLAGRALEGASLAGAPTPPSSISRLTAARAARPVGALAWRYGALAAALLAAVALGGWRLTWERLSSERAVRLERERRLETLAPATPAASPTAPAASPAAPPAESARLEIARLRQRLARLTGPQLNPHVAELLPRLDGDTLRAAPPDGDAALNALDLPGGSGRVTLVLVSPGPLPPASYVVEMRDSSGALLWRAGGLAPKPDGSFTLALPLELLPRGRFALDVLRQGADGARSVARYDVEPRRPVAR